MKNPDYTNEYVAGLSRPLPEKVSERQLVPSSNEGQSIERREVAIKRISPIQGI